MQTLSATLLAAQKAMGDILYKLVLTKAGEDTITYGCDTTNRILDMKHWDDDWLQTVEVVIDDREGNVTSINLIGYQGVVSYGYHTTSDEYIGQAPLKVKAQDLRYIDGDEVCVLSLTGKGNQMEEDKASAINKKGTATSTSAKHLVDTAATFESGDLGKKVYNSTDNTWARVSAYVSGTDLVIEAVASQWVAVTAYIVGDKRKPTVENGSVYICSTAGTSGGSEPSWSTTDGATTSDGTVTWTCYNLIISGESYELHATEHLANSSDTMKTHINAIAGATMPCFSHCEVITVSWDVEDWLIDTYIPSDGFKVTPGQSRLEKIKEALAPTACDGRIESDGYLHIFMTYARAWQANFNYYVGEIVKPITGGDFIYTCTTTGVSGSVEPTWTLGADDTITDNSVVWTLQYDYQYGRESDDHNIYQKSTIRRIVSPNKVIVHSYPDMEESYWGSATEPDSYALLPKTVTQQMRLTSDTQAENIAKAMIDRLARNNATGQGRFPMNVGQEIYDYVLLAEED